MAAPVAVARGAINGIRHDDGFGAAIVFASNPTIELWETSVQPPSGDGGDPIVTSTHRNTARVTKAAQRLVETGDSVVVCTYDPAVVTELDALVNEEQVITVVWGDGTTLAYYGYLRKYEFSPLVKGQQPTVTLTIVATNFDPVNCEEANPVLVAGTGSC